MSVPVPLRRLVVRHEHDRRVELPDPLPRTDRRRSDRARSCSTRTSKPRATTTSTSARSTSSHDHTLLAWSCDIDGDEHYTLRVRDLGDRRRPASTHIVDVCNAGTAWSRDGRYLFYVTADEQERPYRVWRHEVGAGPPAPTTRSSSRRPTSASSSALGETRSDDFVIIQTASKTSSEMRFLSRPTTRPASRSSCAPRARRRRVRGRPLGRPVRSCSRTSTPSTSALLVAPTSSDWTDAAAWTELVPHVAGRRITGADPFAEHLVIHEWGDAQPRLRILFRDGARAASSTSATSRTTSSSAPTRSGTPRRSGSAPVATTPPTLYDEDVAHRRADAAQADAHAERRPRRSTASTRVWATAADGAQVPVDIVRHVDTPLDGTAPGVVYGYGAYEASMPPWFSVARLSLLDRGFVWALVHPRGGGELGPAVVPRRQARSASATRSPTRSPCVEHLVARR